jgi:hypothetical protein
MFENPTVSLREVHSWCAKIARYSKEVIFPFIYASSSIQNANKQFVSCIHFSLVNFALHPTAQTKI